MKLIWLPEARDDVKRLFETLHNADPGVATRAVRAIQIGSKRLRGQPRPGRRMDDDTGRREVFVPVGAGACVLRGRIHNDSAIVIRVWHKREWRGESATG